jgi:hypothetical protein
LGLRVGVSGFQMRRSSKSSHREDGHSECIGDWCNSILNYFT